MPNKFKDSLAFKVGCKMPPLQHKFPDQDFDVMQSPAAQWLIDQPEIRNYLFTKMNSSGAIAFDPETGVWRGIESKNQRKETTK